MKQNKKQLIDRVDKTFKYVHVGAEICSVDS